MHGYKETEAILDYWHKDINEQCIMPRITLENSNNWLEGMSTGDSDVLPISLWIRIIEIKC